MIESVEEVQIAAWNHLAIGGNHGIFGGRPRPAAFLINMSAALLITVLNMGAWIHTKRDYSRKIMLQIADNQNTQVPF
jgi:hypothetical protein